MFDTTRADGVSVNGDGWRCTGCGSFIWQGMFHLCGGTPPPAMPPGMSPACHCWCGDATVNGKPHKTCCMCFGRRLKLAHE